MTFFYLLLLVLVAVTVVLMIQVVGLILVIALLDSTRVYRLSRAVAMDIAVMEYVEAARLRGMLREWAESARPLPTRFEPMLTEETIRRLKSLGYIE